MSKLLEIIAGLTGEGNTTVFPTAYVEWLDGDYVAAVVLNDAVHWTAWSQRKGKFGWFYRTEADWQEARCLSWKQVSRAITAINTRAGATLIQREVRALPNGRATFYRLDVLAFGALVKDEPVFTKGRDPYRLNGETGHAEREISLTESTPENTTENPPTPQGGKRLEDPEGFDEFWKSYPTKAGRPAAVRAYRKMVKSECDQAAVLVGLDRWIASTDWVKDNGQFIPYPATFLNQRRWEDEPKNLPMTNGKRGSAQDGLDMLKRQYLEFERNENDQR
jgi:hypothetical protein